MASLATVLADSDSEYGTRSFARRELDDADICSKVCQFLEQHGFRDFEFAGEGTNVFVVADKQNPNLVLRIARSNDERPIIPQILQPIHVEKITRKITIEFLRNIDVFSVRPSEVASLATTYKKEVETSGYRLDDPRFDKLLEDGGIFTYEDLKQPGKMKSVFMGADASTIDRYALEQKPQPPTCTADYPTLEDQWREQCKMVEADPRLKQMIGGLPPKLPTTRVIPSVSSARSP